MTSSLLLKIKSFFPVSASARVEIARRYYEIGRCADAESETFRALNASPDLEGACRLLGELYENVAPSDGAVERLKELWERDARAPGLASLLADLLSDRKEGGDQAIEIYAAATEADWLPDLMATREFVLDVLARTEYRRGTYAAARKYLERLCEENPSEENRIKLAATQMQLGCYEDAARTLTGIGERARELSAKLHVLRGEFSAAQDVLDERSDDPDVLYDLMLLHFFGTGDFERSRRDAVAFLRGAEEDDPRRVMVDAIARLTDAVEAEEDERLLEAVRTSPDETLQVHLEILGFVGTERIVRGERDAAESLLGRCLEALPVSAAERARDAVDEIVNAYACCLLKRGDAQGAWDLLQRLGNKETLSTLHNLALVAGEVGRSDLEVQYWDRVLMNWEAHADDPFQREMMLEGRRAFSDRLISRNQWERAADELEKVLDSDMEDLEARAKLIHLFLALNRHNDAEKWIQGLMAAPEAEEYRACLKRFIVDRVADMLDDAGAVRIWDRIGKRGRGRSEIRERLARSLQGVYEMRSDTRGSHNLASVLDVIAEKNDERAYARYLRARLFLVEYRDPSILTFTSLQEASEHIAGAQELARDQALRRKIAQVKAEIAAARRSSREE